MKRDTRFGRALLGSVATSTQLASAQPTCAALEGRWGGDRLQLALEANGGRLQMDCASGTIAGPIRPDADGKFVAAGKFEQHRPGPRHADESAASEAQYAGEVKDGTMTLTVTLQSGGAPQVFRLRKGVTVKLVRCL